MIFVRYFKDFPLTNYYLSKVASVSMFFTNFSLRSKKDQSNLSGKIPTGWIDLFFRRNRVKIAAPILLHNALFKSELRNSVSKYFGLTIIMKDILHKQTTKLVLALKKENVYGIVVGDSPVRSFPADCPFIPT